MDDEIEKHLATLRDVSSAAHKVRSALENAAHVRLEIAALRADLYRAKLFRDDLARRVGALWEHANATPVTAVHKRMHEERQLRRRLERDNEALRKELAEVRRELAKTIGGQNHHHINDVMKAAEEAGISRTPRQRLWAALRPSVAVPSTEVRRWRMLLPPPRNTRNP